MMDIHRETTQRKINLTKQMKSEGVPIKAIAQFFNLSTKRIYDYLNIEMTTKEELLEKLNEIKEMVQPGAEISQRRIRLQLLALEILIRKL